MTVTAGPEPGATIPTPDQPSRATIQAAAIQAAADRAAADRAATNQAATEENSSNQNGSGGDDTSPSDLAHALPGAVISAFVGAMAFLGLKANEVSDVLRNQAVLPSVIAVLLLAAVVLSILSTTQKTGEVALSSTVGAIVIALGVGSVLIFFTPIPLTTTPGQRALALGLGIALIVAGIACFVQAEWHLRAPVWLAKSKARLGFRRRHGRQFERTEATGGSATGSDGAEPVPGAQPARGPRPRVVPRRTALLLMGVMTAGIAVYGAMRLEAISQVDAPYAQLGATITESTQPSSLALTVAGSRLRQGDRIGVTIYGLPWHGQPLSTMCQNSTKQVLPGYPCVDDPCPYYFACDELDGALVEPDADGAAKETLTLPFSAVQYQHLKIVAEVCERAISELSCTYADPTQPHTVAKETRLELSVPRPGT